MHLLDLIFEIFKNRRDLRRVPSGLLWLFRPGKRQVAYPARLVYPLQAGNRLKKDLPLAFCIVYLAHRPAERIFNGSHPGYADLAVEFRYHGETDCGETLCLKISRNQPHGPAAQGSGRGEYDDLHPFIMHLRGNLGHGFVKEEREVVLVAVKRIAGGCKPADDTFFL